MAASVQYLPRVRGSISEQSRSIADSILDCPRTEDVEKANGDVTLTAIKCRVLGSLVRFGTPPSTAKALVRLNTSR